MTLARKLMCCLLILIMPNGSLALYSESDKTQRILAYADSVLECGIYYQYTARGMEKNPNIAADSVQLVAHNSRVLLKTANWLYTSIGISTQTRYDEVLLRAKNIIARQHENSAGEDGRYSMSDLIFAHGEKCNILLTSYDSRVREFVDLLTEHPYPLDTH